MTDRAHPPEDRPEVAKETLADVMAEFVDLAAQRAGEHADAMALAKAAQARVAELEKALDDERAVMVELREELRKLRRPWWRRIWSPG